MQRSTQIALLVVVAVLVSAVAGYVGGRIGSSSSSGQASSEENLLAGMQARGELRVGVAPDPLSLVQANGTWTGPDLVPLEDLATTMKVKFTPVETSWDNMVAGLQASQYDFAADLEATTARALSNSVLDSGLGHTRSLRRAIYDPIQDIAGSPGCEPAGPRGDR